MPKITLRRTPNSPPDFDEETQETPNPIEEINEDELFVAETPSVDLLPPSIKQYYEVTSVWKKFGAGIGVITIGFAGFFLYTTINQNDTETKIDTLQNQTRTTQEQATALGDFQTFFTGVDSARTTLSEYTAEHIDTGSINKQISDAAQNAGINLKSLSTNITATSGTGGAAAATTCKSPDPFNTTASSGCVDFSGEANSAEAVTAFLTALNNTEGFNNAYVQSLPTETNKGFSGTVAFTNVFFTNRYADLSISLESLTTATAQPVEENTESETP